MFQGGRLAHCWQRISERVHDWRLGVETRGFLSAAEYATTRDCQSYEPLEYESIAQALRQLSFTEAPQVLVDYGAGMGRVLALASRYPFRRLIGVELSPVLCARARDNMQRLAQRGRTPPTEIVQADAACYEVPTDVTVFFLYNPFVGQVLQDVVRRIEASVARFPRAATVLYVRFPHDNNPFDASAAFRRECVLPVLFRPEMQFVVYRSLRKDTQIWPQPIDFA